MDFDVCQCLIFTLDADMEGIYRWETAIKLTTAGIYLMNAALEPQLPQFVTTKLATWTTRRKLSRKRKGGRAGGYYYYYALFTGGALWHSFKVQIKHYYQHTKLYLSAKEFSFLGMLKKPMFDINARI